MSDLYYLRIRGAVVGPFRADQVRELIQRGKVSRLHELSTDRETWRPIMRDPEFAADFEPHPAAAGPGTSPAAPPSGERAPDSAQPPPVSQQAWYYEASGQPVGPVDEAGVASLVASGRLSPSTLVWTAGMSAWQPAISTALARFFASQAAFGPAGRSWPDSTHSGYSSLGGASNTVVQSQGVPYQGARSYSPHVPNYLVQAILSTLFCCVPLGIVAIVFAARVDSKLAAGDYAGAMAASRSARTWCWASFLTGLAFIGLYVLLTVLGALSGL